MQTRNFISFYCPTCYILNVSNNLQMLKKLTLILIGILFLATGVISTFGLIVYSLKEKDNYGFWGLLISVSIICLGTYSIFKGIQNRIS